MPRSTWATAIASSIKDARRNANMSRNELAEKSGVNRHRIATMEEGVKEFTLSDIGPLCAPLDVSVWEIVESAERRMVGRG